MSDTESKPSKPTAAGWKKANVHQGVTLPSGTVVDITVPNLPKMIASGSFPNALIDVALKRREASDVNEETMKESWEFIKYIVPQMLVTPKITEDDIDDLPIEDVEMLAGFAMRTNDIDAIGHHLGGLETHRRFRELRGLLTIDEVV
jgi:hypothetical protein